MRIFVPTCLKRSGFPKGKFEFSTPSLNFNIKPKKKIKQSKTKREDVKLPAGVLLSKGGASIRLNKAQLKYLGLAPNAKVDDLTNLAGARISRIGLARLIELGDNPGDLKKEQATLWFPPKPGPGRRKSRQALAPGH